MKRKIKLKDAYIIASKNKSEIFIKDALLYQCGWLALDELSKEKDWIHLGDAGGCWAVFGKPHTIVLDDTWPNFIGKWLTGLGFNWNAEVREGGAIGFIITSVKRKI